MTAGAAPQRSRPTAQDTLSDLERYCEIIAALKIRTTNKKGRHLSTVRAIELMETYGIETPDGLVQPPAGLLRRSTKVRRHPDV